MQLKWWEDKLCFQGILSSSSFLTYSSISKLTFQYFFPLLFTECWCSLWYRNDDTMKSAISHTWLNFYTYTNIWIESFHVRVCRFYKISYRMTQGIWFLFMLFYFKLGTLVLFLFTLLNHNFFIKCQIHQSKFWIESFHGVECRSIF
jgi:multidrug efflux pump subunit AcrB